MKWQVCRSPHPGLVEILYKDLEEGEARKRAQAMNDEAGLPIPQHYARRTPWKPRTK